MEIAKILCFVIIYVGYVGADQTPGSVLDATLGKVQQLEIDIKKFNIIHGPCAPCLTIPGTKAYCDCRQLESKQDCLEFYDAGVRINGIYKLEGPRFSPMHAYCDQTTQGGGWTVILRRKDGSVNFNQKWDDYKMGFGRLAGEFWFGNDNIHDLTRSSKTPKSSQLLININRKGQTKPIWARYGSFKVGDEKSKYLLQFSGFSGNTTDRLSSHNGMKFTTTDQDNDKWGGNCARTYAGGWWYYGGCYGSHLTGEYRFAKNSRNILWDSYSAQPEFVEMKVRRNK